MATLQDTRIPYVFLTAILLIVALESLTSGRGVASAPNEPSRPAYTASGIPCKGAPIKVDYAYDGYPVGPNECLKQCNNKQQMYILYTNGLATQCQDDLGCNDTGEDGGTTCQLASTKAKAS